MEVFISKQLKTLYNQRPRRKTEKSHFAQFQCKISPFRMNTYKNVSKQTTLTPFRMNTYKKHRGVGAFWSDVHLAAASRRINSCFFSSNPRISGAAGSASMLR